jgi:hypothetical protein
MLAYQTVSLKTFYKSGFTSQQIDKHSLALLKVELLLKRERSIRTPRVTLAYLK